MKSKKCSKIYGGNLIGSREGREDGVGTDPPGVANTTLCQIFQIKNKQKIRGRFLSVHCEPFDSKKP